MVSIEPPAKVYRPSLPSEYRDPALGDDLLDGHWANRDLGKSLIKKKAELPERDDIELFEEAANLKELDANIRFDGCPDNMRNEVISLIKEYWDVFAEGGLRKPIRGFEFQVDTGDSKPVCCKPPRYGKHESAVMRRLVKKLEENGIIEDDDGPWGALAVLAAKPHQEEVPWQEFRWRLCVSYRKLNQVTRPYAFPIPRCNDAVEDIDTEAKFFIAIDLDSGYWQVSAAKKAREKLAFFTPDGKKR